MSVPHTAEEIEAKLGGLSEAMQNHAIFDQLHKDILTRQENAKTDHQTTLDRQTYWRDQAETRISEDRSLFNEKHRMWRALGYSLTPEALNSGRGIRPLHWDARALKHQKVDAPLNTLRDDFWRKRKSKHEQIDLNRKTAYANARTKRENHYAGIDTQIQNARKAFWDAWPANDVSNRYQNDRAQRHLREDQLNPIFSANYRADRTARHQSEDDSKRVLRLDQYAKRQEDSKKADKAYLAQLEYQKQKNKYTWPTQIAYHYTHWVHRPLTEAYVSVMQALEDTPSYAYRSIGYVYFLNGKQS